MRQSYRIAKGPKLSLEITYADQAVHFVTLAPSTSDGLEWRFQSSKVDSSIENGVEAWLQDYSNKKTPTIAIPFGWKFLPAFIQKALQKLPSIEFGNTLTYGEIAALVGHPKAARAVGTACRTNPFPLFIPCHRVLNAQNRLRGYSAESLIVKEILLSFEGIQNYKI